jgi:hypothetical protein
MTPAPEADGGAEAAETDDGAPFDEEPGEAAPISHDEEGFDVDFSAFSETPAAPEAPAESGKKKKNKKHKKHKK